MRVGDTLMSPIDVHIHNVVGEVDVFHVIDMVQGGTDEEGGAEDRHRKVGLLCFDVLPDSLLRFLLGDAIRDEIVLQSACVFYGLGVPILLRVDAVGNSFGTAISDGIDRADEGDILDIRTIFVGCLE